ncbi:tRNA (5-methylaminomethyl-2-thiouridine)(34)-methyltransferase MnmD [Aquimarina brevivitae]|uniref:tRNA U34 5-methylaminomethyl-2-thiouridine-forming methyltransferase MnmC n=1 Tax=Aquimarina brevivitae TaxID=323412 RepID=A0A4V2F7L3_9FLAO|nr:tRNA (5-methylaminomethyl-2-thiouridine)(34)-methyltransferase MnmD [Aquimarina brevivitae]RZT00220.1 tRNA U34 5-methylaminomethyl-2-thiouridine-forming methyltransferase MnmC [Aquimarina brevivitae]
MQKPQKREILITGDGSATIHLPDWNEQYHSKHGAIQEAKHVFIKHGFHYSTKRNTNTPLSILEIGFGTGLNAFITYLEANNNAVPIQYTGVEAYPVALKEIQQLHYAKQLDVAGEAASFLAMHDAPWESPTSIGDNFSLTKRKQFFKDIADEHCYDLIYFDAFGARVQPELWTVAIFKKMYIALKTQGVLVTYAAKGSVRRAMEEVGFTVERLPGPPGKREMLRALKP